MRRTARLLPLTTTYGAAECALKGFRVEGLWWRVFKWRNWALAGRVKGVVTMSLDSGSGFRASGVKV